MIRPTSGCLIAKGFLIVIYFETLPSSLSSRCYIICYILIMQNLQIPQYISVNFIFKVKFIALMKGSFLSDVEPEFLESKFGWAIAQSDH